MWSKTNVVYNENELYAAQWLRNLAGAGHIADGRVDDRSIRDLAAVDVAGATQFHAFAGIGVWSHALRLAGWPDDRPVWTGSCPCQPFSQAGKGKGFDDERHLWPIWRDLIAQCRPATVFGEQVASPAGRTWLDVVSADLEALGYRVAAADLCAAGVGAPHRRQRLFWVAYADSERLAVNPLLRPETRRRDTANLLETAWDGAPSGLGDTDSIAGRRSAGSLASSKAGNAGSGFEHQRLSDSAQSPSARHGPERRLGQSEPEAQARGTGATGGVADTAGGRQHARGRHEAAGHRQAEFSPHDDLPAGFWSNADWLACRDDKARPVEPGSFPLAHGVANRVGRLRAYGNAIVAQVAAAFIVAAEEASIVG